MRLTILALLALLALVAAWTKEDHEIFRLRDELLKFEGDDVTFYDFLSVSPKASQTEIIKAVREKSKLFHPDKARRRFLASHATAASKSARSAAKTKTGKAAKPSSRATKPPSEKEIEKAIKLASEKSTRLNLIGDILKGEGRARYDHFLANGFPAWRGADYYYARFRPGLGSVLLGLFFFSGGAVHYGILVLGHKRQRDFVERYIRQARTLAWGDASPAAGIPGIDTAGTAAAASSSLSQQDPDQQANVQTMNRRERRAQEKQSKKPSAAQRRGAQGSGTSTPQATAADDAAAAAARIPVGSPVPGPKKRVQAENGKILIVDSAGNVFLEEEDEDGNLELFLLDPNEVQPPTFGQTLVVRLPVWAWGKIREKLSGGGAGGEGAGSRTSWKERSSDGARGEELIDGFVDVKDEDAYEKGNGNGKKRNKNKNKTR